MPQLRAKESDSWTKCIKNLKLFYRTVATHSSFSILYCFRNIFHSSSHVATLTSSHTSKNRLYSHYLAAFSHLQKALGSDIHVQFSPIPYVSRNRWKPLISLNCRQVRISVYNLKRYSCYLFINYHYMMASSYSITKWATKMWKQSPFFRSTFFHFFTFYIFYIYVSHFHVYNFLKPQWELVPTGEFLLLKIH